MNASSDTATLLNLDLIKARQKAAWQAGDFGPIARTMESMAEEFMSRLNLQPGMRVLDLGCGTGNLTLIAARSGCYVSGIDIASNSIAQARARAEAAGLKVDLEEGDAEAIPCAGCQFDAVVSMFGVMSAPRAKVATAELRRVTRRGGFIALANWTPTSLIGQMFEIVAAHVPPPAGLRSPMLWGDEETVQQRLRDGFTSVRCSPRRARMRYPFSPPETVEFFRRYFGPVQRAFESLAPSGQEALRRDLIELQTKHNLASQPGETEVVGEYLEVVAERS